MRFQVAASTGTVGQLLSTQSSTPPIQVWTVNTGTATFTNASSFHRVQFTTSDAGSVGNLLDAIQLTLRPFVQISTANSAALESSGTAGLATLVVTGAAASPISDKRGTVAFRKEVVGVLARRAAAIALERAKGAAR